MNYIFLVAMLILAVLVGCSPVVPIIEPVTSIMITPESSEIGMNESVELFCYDQLDRPVMAKWSKNCGAGTLSVLIGKSCIYTTPNYNEGYQIIWAEYEGLKAEARVNGVKERM